MTRLSENPQKKPPACQTTSCKWYGSAVPRWVAKMVHPAVVFVVVIVLVVVVVITVVVVVVVWCWW